MVTANYIRVKGVTIYVHARSPAVHDGVSAIEYDIVSMNSTSSFSFKTKLSAEGAITTFVRGPPTSNCNVIPEDSQIHFDKDTPQRHSCVPDSSGAVTLTLNGTEDFQGLLIRRRGVLL
jgi:hypothetical protein